MMRVESNKLGMAFFIASEAFFFSLLILAYLYFQTAPATANTAAHNLDPVKTGFFSLFLLASSLSIWRAGREASDGRSRQAAGYVILTILLGIVFLAGQGLEWRRLILSGTSVNQGLFGTTFFTLTGFHGLHVLIGLIALTIFSALTLAPGSPTPKASSLETLSLYWHFVDAVWIVIFTVIYLRVLIT